MTLMNTFKTLSSIDPALFTWNLSICLSVFFVFAVTCWCWQLPVTVRVVVFFINPAITVHLPSVSVATIDFRSAQRLSCVALMCFHWSLPVFHYILCPLFETVVGPALDPRSAAVHWDYQRYQSSKIQLISFVLYYRQFIIFALVWMRPHKTLNHFVRLNHYMATFQWLSLAISIILFVCECVLGGLYIN